ncbi:hypothetical protein N7522_007075 [Penicillium canescens]|nr:hypothetical protein N7522_007075 [Penicillium canescens]
MVCESRLERKGLYTELQKYRWSKSDAEMESPLLPLLRTELELREVVQRELSLQNWKPSHEETKKEDKGNQTREEAVQIQLQVLNKRYWLLEREWWKHRYDCSGPVRRAFEFWRSHSQWYLHRNIIECCAARGGCCGFSCGCCVNRKIPEGRKLGVGHCTDECECCKARVSSITDLTEAQKEVVYSDFDLNLSTSYYDALCRASIWGLPPVGMCGDERSPSELIRQPIYHLIFSLKGGRMLIGYKAVLTDKSRCEIIVICFILIFLMLGVCLIAMI